MTVTTSNARHVLFRLSDPARLPDALIGTLRDEVILAGWMRASGILHDVVVRALGGTTVRSLRGIVQVVALEGSIGLSQGDVTCGLRAVLARETDTGLETIAGEILEARIDALEVMVTAFDDIAATRQAGVAGVWLLNTYATNIAGHVPATTASAATATPAATPSATTASAATATPAPTTPATTTPAMESAPSKPDEAKPAAPKPSPTFSAPAGPPLRPVRPKTEESEPQEYPDEGDVVEHFAFGRCDVVKSDGDRLHLRLGKDGRIKEIALEMLKVTPLPPVEGASGRHFKLDRKL